MREIVACFSASALFVGIVLTGGENHWAWIAAGAAGALSAALWRPLERGKS